MRTLFIPQGLERDRILAAIGFHIPDKVVIIRNTNDTTPELTKAVERQINILKKRASRFPFTITWEELWVNFFTPYHTLVQLYDAISSEEDPRVDISSGNKTIGAILYVVASQLGVPTTYSSSSTGYGKIPGYGRLMVLPLLPISLDVDVSFLKKLLSKNQWSSISELAEAVYGNAGKSEILTVSRKIESLAAQGVVKVFRQGRQKKIKIIADS